MSVGFPSLGGQAMSPLAAPAMSSLAAPASQSVQINQNTNSCGKDKKQDTPHKADYQKPQGGLDKDTLTTLLTMMLSLVSLMLSKVTQSGQDYGKQAQGSKSAQGNGTPFKLDPAKKPDAYAKPVDYKPPAAGGQTAGADPASATPMNANGKDVQQAVQDEVNKFRAENGLGPVKLNDKLNDAAQKHSDDQAANGNMTHTGSDGSDIGDRVKGSGYNYSTVAENVAWNQESPKEVVQAWIDSPGHRANLLKKDVNEIGVGFNNRYWTLVEGGAK